MIGSVSGPRVGITGLGSTLADGHSHGVDWSPDAVRRTVETVRSASDHRDRRPELEALVQAEFSLLTYAQAVDRLTEAQTAYGAINSVHDLIGHPQLRTKAMEVGGAAVQIPAAPYVTEWDDPVYRKVPAIGEHDQLPGGAA